MTDTEGLVIGSLLDAWASVRTQFLDEMGEDGEQLANWLDALNMYMEFGVCPRCGNEHTPAHPTCIWPMRAG